MKFIITVVMSWLGSLSNVSANNVILTANQDSFTAANFPASNYSNLSEMEIRGGDAARTANWRYIYAAWDLSGRTLASNETVVSATISFVNAGTQNGPGTGTMSLYEITGGTWSETNITWNTQPYAGSTALASVAVDSSDPSETTIYEFTGTNLNQLVEQWLRSPNSNDGVRLELPVTWGLIRLYSKEAENPAYRPVLEYTTDRHTLLLAADTCSWVESTAPTNNYGSSSSFMVRNGSPTGIRRFGYVRWDIDGMPSNAVIDSAELLLVPVFRSAYYETATVSVRKVLSGWAEDDVTWNTGPLVDYQNVIAGVEYPATSPTSVYLDLQSEELKNLIQGWSSGSISNHGLEVATSGYRYIGFASDDEEEILARPLLLLSVLSDVTPQLTSDVIDLVEDDVVNGGIVIDDGTRIDKTYAISTPQATVNVDLETSLGAFPDYIRGIGLVPQIGTNSFTPEGIQTFSGLFQGTSVRLWGTKVNPLSGESFYPLVEAAYPGNYFSFFPSSKLTDSGVYQAEYNSEADNNLPLNAQPSENVLHAFASYNALEQLLQTNDFTMYYEVYNEPQFDNKGCWQPEDFSRYVNDVAALIKASNSNIRVAAPLHLSDVEWNDTFLSMLNPANIDCIVNHNYGFVWVHISQYEQQSYYARIGETARQKERLEEDISLVQEYGQGNWKYALTEWNIHPNGYVSTNMVSTDMGAALYQALMIKNMVDAGVDDAQVFQLISEAEFSHFGLVNNSDTDLNTGRQAPFYTHQFVAEYLSDGERVPASVSTETFPWDMYYQVGKWDAQTFDVPWISVMAAKETGNLALVIINLAPESVTVTVNISGGSTSGDITGQALNSPDYTGSWESSGYAVTNIEYQLTNVLQQDGSLAIPVLPRSLTALYIPFD